MAEDLLSVIRALANKGWFSLEQYNSALKSFRWLLHEMFDKPQQVPLSKKIGKLKGKACSQWVHMRNWPLLVKKFSIDKDDEVLALGLKLHEVTERITATEYREYEIQLLHDSVLDYLDMRKRIRMEMPQIFSKPKPKHHFIRLAVRLTIRYTMVIFFKFITSYKVWVIHQYFLLFFTLMLFWKL